MNTTALDFAVFKAEAERFAGVLSLGDWHLIYEHSHCENALAEARLDSYGKCAVIALAEDWLTTPITKETVEMCARHEVYHVLLADMVYLANSRICTDWLLTQAQHAVIRRLENAYEAQKV